MELRVEVSGENPAVLLTHGFVADISRGGVRCDIDVAVPVWTRVDLSFPDVPGGALDPCSLQGHVVRTASTGGVPDQIAIAFADPLEQLDADRLRAHRPVVPSRARATAARRTSRADRASVFPSFTTA